MNNTNKGLTFAEIIVVITIIVIITGFGFLKVSDYFGYDDTINNIESIRKTIIDNKINSNFHSSKNTIFFNKNLNGFYIIYNDEFENENNFSIDSGSLVDDNLEISLSSENILSKSKKLIIDNSDNIVSRDITFDSQGKGQENISINISNIEDTKLYIKSLDGVIETGYIKIIPNSQDMNLVLSQIQGINFANNQKNYDFLKIDNSKNGKSLIYGLKNNVMENLMKAKITFLDNKGNYGYLDIN